MEPKIIEGSIQTVKDYGFFHMVIVDDNCIVDTIKGMSIKDGKKIRFTIEVLEDEAVEEDEPTINFTLRQIIKNDDAIKGLRLNPYCMNEGADPYARYEIKLSDAKKWGLV